MNTAIVLSLLTITQALLQDYQNQQTEQRPPTPDEDARSKAAQDFANKSWAGLAPKGT